MLKNYILSDACRGKLHCTRCRSKSKGRLFREHLFNYLTIKIPCVDFDCPFGYEWGAKIEPEFVPRKIVFQEGNQRVPTSAQMNENTELSIERFTICKTCDKSSENGHKCSLHKGCCFGRWRSNPENKCPDNLPKWEAKIIEKKS
jgi:hypothetical protein